MVLTDHQVGRCRSPEWLDNPYVVRYYVEFVKIIVIALFTTGQVDTKKRHANAAVD